MKVATAIELATEMILFKGAVGWSGAGRWTQARAEQGQGRAAKTGPGRATKRAVWRTTRPQNGLKKKNTGKGKGKRGKGV